MTRRKNIWSAYETDPIEFETPRTDEPPPEIRRKLVKYFQSDDGFELTHRFTKRRIKTSNIKIGGWVCRTYDVVRYLSDGLEWPWVRRIHYVDCDCYRCVEQRSRLPAVEPDAYGV